MLVCVFLNFWAVLNFMFFYYKVYTSAFISAEFQDVFCPNYHQP